MSRKDGMLSLPGGYFQKSEFHLKTEMFSFPLPKNTELYLRISS